jgi:asparagine synthase (glutamine-hydrolysing)
MANQSGLFAFDRGCTLRQNGEDVWLGERQGDLARHPSGLTATWDGRIDNRDELLMRLGERTAPDADIALAMFAHWGTDGLASIVGEWSLVVWDAARRTVHLARDYMGARPLYYYADAAHAAWSADLCELVTRTGLVDDLSERFAAGFMTLGVRSAATPYEGVHAVPPGVCVSVTAAGAIAASRFWRLDAGEIRYRDPRTYEEHLRVLWREAVRARLRTNQIVWAELSGGLDSSSVVCMADALIKSRVAPAPALRTVSHATLHSPEGDERRFIAEVERSTGVRSKIVGVEDSQDCTDPERAWVTPYALQGVGLDTVRRVRDDGGRIVLSGRLGDAVMGCQPDNSVAVFDDLGRGRVSTALRNMRAWSRATRKPFLEIAWRLLQPENSAPADTGVDLLMPRLRDLLRDAPGIDVPSGLRRSKRPLARMVLGYTMGLRLDIPHRPPGIVYAYPFVHRPLVDFVLAIPGEQLSAPGATRSLMRRAFSGLVPARVIRRVSKGYYPPAAYRAARQLAASLTPRDLEVVDRGWIDPDRLQAAFHALTDGGGETGGDIHTVLRLEAWLQARRARLPIPLRKEVNTNEVLHA